MTIPIWLTRCRRHFRLRYSLRTLLLAVLAFNIGCARWLAYQRHQRAVLENETLAAFGNDGQSCVVQGIEDDGTEVCVVFASHKSIDGVLNLPNVVSLRLVATTDDDLALVANLAHLRELAIESDTITDEGLRQLVCLDRLTNLSIRSDNITGVGLASLVSLGRLSELNLYGSQFDPALMRSFRAQQPRMIANLTIPTPPAPPFGGTTRETERTATSAIYWLARHQAADGSWSFDANPAATANLDKVAATSLALLPFLTAGQTPDSNGPFKQTVNRGFQYLSSQRIRGPMGSHYGDSLTAHALATIVQLDSKSRFTPKDPLDMELIKYIADRQDCQTGGWADEATKPIDNVTTCWQLHALLSAQCAGLAIPADTILRAKAYVESLHFPDLEAGDGPVSISTVAGVLSGIRLGWRRDHPLVVSLSKRLVQIGPSKTDPLWNLWVQMIRNSDCSTEWAGWNRRFRRQTMFTVSQSADKCGSWFTAPAAPWGGRLWATSLNCWNCIYRMHPSYLNMYSDKFDCLQLPDGEHADDGVSGE